jgi:hypothetical protein
MNLRGKSAMVLSALLLLTSCGSSTPVINGQIVPCNQINLIENPAKDLTLDCLDGSGSVNLAAIKGLGLLVRPLQRRAALLQ